MSWIIHINAILNLQHIYSFSSIFFLSHNVFSSYKEKFMFWPLFDIFSANVFNFDKSTSLLFGKSLI